MEKMLYIPPLGGGIRDLRDAGQHRKLLEDYGSAYLQQFEEVLILSFFAESLEDYGDIPPNPRLKILPNRGRWQKYIYAFLAPWLHRKELRGVRVVRVSQATGALPALFFRWYFRCTGQPCPVVITYGYDYVLFASIRGRMAKLLAKLHEFLARQAADFWITTTKELVELLENRHGVDSKSIWLIPNGVKLDQFQPATIGSNQVQHLLFVGRLEAQKNLPYLIHCVDQAARALGQNLELHIVGTGSLQKELAAIPLSSGAKIHFLGSVENSLLPELLNRADAFVTMSHFEGNPKAVLEAMAAGLPIIGKDAPGVGNLLRDAKQLVCTSENDFIGSILVLNDSRYRQEKGRLARQWAETYFDLRKNLERETQLLWNANDL